MLNLGTEKMSKSLGNVLTIRKLLDTYSSEVLRYALLSGQYRSSLTWSDDLLAQARASLDSLYQSLRDTAAHSALTSNDMQALALEDYPTDVVAALSDDLNTPKALAAMHDLAAQLRRAENNTARDHAARRLLAGGWLLGLLYQPAEDYFTQGQPGNDASLAAADIESMIEQRKAARANGDYAGADRIRDELLNAGIELEDSREGTRWRKI
jgi:cysteinyl-tRNA synthetase